MLDWLVDWGRQLLGIPAVMDVQPPVPPVTWTPGLAPGPALPGPREVAERLHRLRPEVSIEDFEKQVQNPIASRVIAVYVEVEVPLLGKSLVFDTRVDNPDGVSPTLKALPPSGPGSPWPNPPQSRPQNLGPTPLGHSGSSCPGMFSGQIRSRLGSHLEIPVEVLGFHCEGRSAECAYSISMYSEVLGRVSAPLDDPSRATLNMWGKMMITIRPHDPGQFGGHAVIQLVSKDYVRQSGTVSGFPPHKAGEYVESAGDEVYVGVNPGQRHLSAIVRRGRIIFSTDIDQFLQARTRIADFTLLDREGADIPVGPPPYDPALIGRIAGVRLRWADVRATDNRVTHYLLYRMDTDRPEKKFSLVSGQLTEPVFVDRDYDGRVSFSYAVVPAFVDQVGMEVQGVSLDHSVLMAIEPRAEQFRRRNQGVGHIHRM